MVDHGKENEKACLPRVVEGMPYGVRRHPLRGNKAFLIGVKPYPGRGLTLPSQPFGYTQTVVRLYPNDRSPILKCQTSILQGCRVGVEWVQTFYEVYTRILR